MVGLSPLSSGEVFADDDEEASEEKEPLRELAADDEAELGVDEPSKADGEDERDEMCRVDAEAMTSSNSFFSSTGSLVMPIVCGRAKPGGGTT
jgi:hypothetical protein